MPRPYAAETGLPNTESFPHPAREAGRRLGLYDSAVIWTRTKVDDGGGDITETWTSSASVDARLDALGGQGEDPRGGAFNENSSHMVTFRDGQSLNTDQQIGIAGARWAVMAIREHTDELVVRAEVMKL